MKGMLSALLLATVTTLPGLLACSGEAPSKDGAPAAAEEVAAEASQALAKIGEGPHPVVRLEVGELGALEMELYPEIAPNTVEHFLGLAESGFYDGTKFHRVIPGFMIQGGDPISKNPDPRRYGQGGLGRTIPDEFSDYPHVRGTLAMANKGKPNSGSTQFFIVHEDSRELDGSYTAFGKVIQGLELVDAVTKLEIDKFGRYGPPDRPYPVDAVLTRATVIRPGDPAPVDEISAGNTGADAPEPTRTATPKAPAAPPASAPDA